MFSLIDSVKMEVAIKMIWWLKAYVLESGVKEIRNSILILSKKKKKLNNINNVWF
jgi:hypothetical protein